jgi:sporulation protein YlmC with PRC-barrel domain
MIDGSTAMRLFDVFSAAVALVLATATLASAADLEGLPGSEAQKGQKAQKCLSDLQAFEEQLWRVGFGVLAPGGYGASTPPGYSGFYVYGIEATPRKKMQALRDAAYVYVFDGDEQSCQRELTAMRAVYEQHQKLIGTETDDSNVRTAWRRAHLARAEPITEMDHLMRLDVLIGSEIRNSKDEQLGEIADVVLNPEKRDILYVLVSSGGFIAFGGKQVAVRWSDLRATEDHELYVLDVAAKAMDEAPVVDRKNFATTASREWRRSLDRYWDGVLK